MKRFVSVLSVFIALQASMAAASQLQLDKITLPRGFKISVYADGVAGARSMTLGDDGTLFVGSLENGNLYAVTPDRKVHTIAENMTAPNGVAFRDGSLYVAEISRILRYDQIEKNLDNKPKPVVIADDFPTDKHHGWKFIAFGPDGDLYVPVGANCNICDPKLPYASITRMHPDGSGRETFARGIRNTVGFTWHPVTHEMWFTDNGRDLMGDDLPPDELNRAPKAGMHFGYPYCHAGDIPDPEFGKKHSCSEFTPPEVKLGPHVAPLGLRFYTGKMFPPEYKNQLFIAEHGSWNRSVPIGYRISKITMGEDGRPKSYAPFADGWLQNKIPWGRPVDVQQMPDGSLLVSDDLAGVIYRITYEP